MHDLVIRNGLLVDGSGAPSRPADVAIDGDRIVEVTGPERPGGPPGDRRRRPARHPGLRRHPHPLRRPGHLGPGGHPVGLARRDHRRHGQLRRRLRPGRARSPRLADPTHGGRRGHPRHGAGRGDELELGELPRVPRRARAHAPGHGRRGPGAPRRGARLRDGRAGRGQRGRHRRRTSPRMAEIVRGGASAPARSASRPPARCCTGPRTASSPRAPPHRWTSCSASATPSGPRGAGVFEVASDMIDPSAEFAWMAEISAAHRAARHLRVPAERRLARAVARPAGARGAGQRRRRADRAAGGGSARRACCSASIQRSTRSSRHRAYRDDRRPAPRRAGGPRCAPRGARRDPRRAGRPVRPAVPTCCAASTSCSRSATRPTTSPGPERSVAAIAARRAARRRRSPTT